MRYVFHAYHRRDGGEELGAAGLVDGFGGRASGFGVEMPEKGVMVFEGKLDLDVAAGGDCLARRLHGVRAVPTQCDYGGLANHAPLLCHTDSAHLRWINSFTPAGSTVIPMKAWRSLIALALLASGGAAGSAANLESREGGPRPATAVTLTALSPDGNREIVVLTPASPLTFTPTGTRLPVESTKQTLQLAAELLVSQGIQDPTPEQLRAALIGGAVATPSGARVSLRGVLDPGR